ncbi:MAG TPA: MBL fold metallo-hydrolase [Acetobacteraceae bacterium]|nr:MBL fold metallo-hydrolase [Acetobacteraceae bacterium]
MPGLRVGVVPVTPFTQNCTLLWDETTKEAVIIDAGGDVPRIVEVIEKQGLDVKALWLTHGHLDHAGGVMELRDQLKGRNVEIVGPDRRDAMLLENLQQQGEMFGMKGMRDVTPDRWLTEGEQVRVGTHVFDVLHCPGHTPGHVVFVNHALKFAQVGDVLFRGSVGRTDFPYGDHAALIGAIKTKLLPLGDDFSFICGHGPNSTIGAERRTNPFVQ